MNETKTDESVKEVARISKLIEVTQPIWSEHLKNVLTEIEELRKENFKLAAGACPNVVGDEGGTPRCSEIQRLKRTLEKAMEVLQKAGSDPVWPTTLKRHAGVYEMIQEIENVL